MRRRWCVIVNCDDKRWWVLASSKLARYVLVLILTVARGSAADVGRQSVGVWQYGCPCLDCPSWSMYASLYICTCIVSCALPSQYDKRWAAMASDEARGSYDSLNTIPTPIQYDTREDNGTQQHDTRTSNTERCHPAFLCRSSIRIMRSTIVCCRCNAFGSRFSRTDACNCPLFAVNVCHVK